MSGEGEDEVVPDNEDDREEGPGRNEPLARFNAQHVFTGSISPLPTESEMESQSLAGTQDKTASPGLATAPLKLYPDAPQPYNSTSHATSGDLPGIGNDEDGDSSVSDDDVNLSEGDVDVSQDREEAELQESALDVLWHNTEGLAKLLRDPKPEKKSWRTLLGIFHQNWLSTRALYVAPDEVFIDLSEIVKDLNDDKHLKAQAVVAGVNATALLENLSGAVSDGDNCRLVRLFELLLEKDFPAPFRLDGSLGEEDVELALDVRTHRLITMMKHSGDKELRPIDVTRELFCAVEAPPVDSMEALRNGPYQNIKGCHLTERVGERARMLLELIQEKSVAEAIQVLDYRFPLIGTIDMPTTHPDDYFVSKISAWCGRIIDAARKDWRDCLSSPLSSPRDSPARASSPTNSLASSLAQDIVRKDV